MEHKRVGNVHFCDAERYVLVDKLRNEVWKPYGKIDPYMS